MTFSTESIILSVKTSYCRPGTLYLHSRAVSEHGVSLDDIRDVREASVERRPLWRDKDGKRNKKKKKR